MSIFEQNAGAYPHYKEMRATTPVFFNPEQQVWEVYGYQDIQTVLSNPAIFSSEIFNAIGRPDLQTLVTMDPPRQTKFRRLVAQAFTSKMVAAQAPNIHAIVNELLDKVIADGEMDLIKDMAFPLPVAIVAGMLGIPRSDQALFKSWAVPAVKVAEMAMQRKTADPHLVASVTEMIQYLEAFAIDRRQNPQEDLISSLATANVDGDYLSIQDISSTCQLLLIGGFDTTTNFIGNAMHLLLQDIDSLMQLRADVELFPTMLEEVLRISTPFQFFARLATSDVELGGQLIKAGQWVMIFNASGNRDETAFSDPDRFDIRRSPNRHLTFGYGIHFCLGAGLSRLETQIAINTMLERLPDLRLNDAKPRKTLDSAILFGFESLPVLFTPAGN